MSDAERDAWLREALRHAPDSGALPPRDVSEAILAEARAAARSRHASPSQTAPGATARPWATFWAWLARPPVAAGFASVMAATLVGMLWWDRPMDETLARPPATVSERAHAPSPSDVAAAAKSKTPAGIAADTSANRASPATVPPPTGDATGALAQAPQTRRQASALQESASTSDAKVAPPSARDKLKLDDSVAKENSARSKRNAEAPAAFPPSKPERDAPARKPPVAAMKDGAAVATPAGDAPAPVAKPSLSTAAPAAPAAPVAPAPGTQMNAAEAAPPAVRRRADDKDERASAEQSADLDLAKKAPPPLAAQTPATAAAPAATPAPSPAPSQLPAPAMRGGALGAAREKQASAFASSPPTPLRNEVAAQRESERATAPRTPLLGALANDPAGWSRAGRDGVVPLDAGWREWLTQLDVAAAGRWRQHPVAPDAAIDTAERAEGATTLRLIAPGRPQIVVRLEGSTVRVDGATAGGRWQATLPAAGAERLRAAAERLTP